MTAEVVSILGVGVTVLIAVVGFGITLMREIGDLRERMARLEGLFEGFTQAKPAGGGQ